MFLGELNNCSTDREMNLTVYFYSAGLQALLAEGIVDFEIMWKRKLLPTHSTKRVILLFYRNLPTRCNKTSLRAWIAGIATCRMLCACCVVCKPKKEAPSAPYKFCSIVESCWIDLILHCVIQKPSLFNRIGSFKKSLCIRGAARALEEVLIHHKKDEFFSLDIFCLIPKGCSFLPLNIK